MYHSRLVPSIFVLLALVFIAGCGAAVPAAPAAPTATLSGAMDHDMHATHSGDSDTPFDARFIDGMIVHHEGALVMAEQALAEASRPELRAMAEAIIAGQAGEITQMQAWREAWYPDLELTEWAEMDMGPMEVAPGETPFEQRFIEAMIPHHEGALVMAQDALAQSEREEIRALAEAIIVAQEAEIAQMRTWLSEWYSVTP
jgi:uncharacterized protein (DUF305 family)